VILGVGFGGIGALKKLRDADVPITIVDKRNYHTFQPLLYQVATDELGPTEVGFPIRELLHGHKNITYHQAAVKSVDLAQKQVVMDGVAAIRTTIWSWLWARWLTSFTRRGRPYALRSTRWKMPFALKSISSNLEAVDKNRGS
jgi:NADH dehydrogenase FAD-containing subunit